VREAQDTVQQVLCCYKNVLRSSLKDQLAADIPAFAMI
jgi:hypothetical protein